MRWLVFSLLLVVLFALLVSTEFFNKYALNVPGTNSPNDRVVASDPFDRFSINNIVSKEYVGNKLLYEMKATKVVHKKRQSDFFVYQNLKEVRFRNVHLEIYPETLPAFSERGAVQLPIALLAGNFIPNVKRLSPENIQQYVEDEPDIDLDILSRIVMEDLSIFLRFAGGKTFLLTADVAKINTNPEVVEFDGNFHLSTPVGNQLSASRAIWSSEHGGIYIPELPHSFNGQSYQNNAFYRIKIDGNIIREKYIQDIDFVDKVEVKEAEFRERISKKAPFFLRMLLHSNDVIDNHRLRQ